MYRVWNPGGTDPRRSRVFVVVSRQVLIDSRHATVICAPVCSHCEGLSTQVPLGIEEGMEHDSAIHCDALVSLRRTHLTDFIATLPHARLRELDAALKRALAL